MPYREARSVAESSEGSTASKSDRTGRNPGMTRLVRRSSATSGGTAILSLVQTFRRCMRKCSGSPIRTMPKKDAGIFLFLFLFLRAIDISVDCTCINVTVRTVRACLVFWRQRWEMVSCRLARLKCFSCLSGLSVHEFQDLPIQFGQVLKAKNFNRCCILLVGLGEPTLIKNLWNENRGCSLVVEWQNYPEFFSGMYEATWEARDWPSWNGWLKRGRR